MGLKVVGIVLDDADRLAENLDILGEIADTGALIEGVHGAAEEETEVVRAAEEPEVGIAVDVEALIIELGLGNLPILWADMSAVDFDEIEGIALKELDCGSAPEEGLHNDFEETFEARGRDEVVHRIDLGAVTVGEKEDLVGDGLDTLVADTGEVSVECEEVMIEVIKAVTVRAMDRLGTLDCLFERADVLTVTVGCDEREVVDDNGLLLRSLTLYCWFHIFRHESTLKSRTVYC